MITVVILAKNEAINLKQLLPTISWADSILIVDDHSTDETAKIARSFDARVIQHRVDGDFATARNVALHHIPTGWVLFLDADERVDEQLIHEVLEISKTTQRIGFQVQRQDVFLNKVLQHGETQSVWLTRLAQVNSGEWKGKVHEVWDISPTKRLKGKIIHHSHESIQQLFKVVPGYALIRAKELYEQKQFWSLWEQITYPVAKLFLNLIVRRAFLDGWPGIVMAIAMSWHSWLVRWYLWDLPWIKKDLTTLLSKYFYIVVWLLVPLGQLNRIQLTQTLAVNVFEVYMGMFVITRLPFSFTFIKSQLLTPIGIFSLVLAFSWLLSLIMGGSYTGGFYWMRWWLYMFFIGLSWISLDTLNMAISGLVRFVGYGLLVGGMVQYLVVPDLRWLYLLGWDDHYYRMTGILLDPNFFGLLMILIGLWAVFNEQKRLKYAVLLLCLLAIAATFSRATYLTFGILLAFFVVKTKRIAWLIGAVGVGIFLILLPKPGGEGVNLLRSFSVGSRIDTWKQAWELFLHYPLFGIGFNQYPSYFPIQNQYGQPIHVSAPDNSLLYVLVTTGIVGFLCFGWMILSWVNSLKHNLLIPLSLLAVLVHSMFNNGFFYPFVMLWMGLVLLDESTKTTLKN